MKRLMLNGVAGCSLFTGVLALRRSPLFLRPTYRSWPFNWPEIELSRRNVDQPVTPDDAISNSARVAAALEIVLLTDDLAPEVPDVEPLQPIQHFAAGMLRAA